MSQHHSPLVSIAILAAGFGAIGYCLGGPKLAVETVLGGVSAGAFGLYFIRRAKEIAPESIPDPLVAYIPVPVPLEHYNHWSEYHLPQGLPLDPQPPWWLAQSPAPGVAP